MLRRFEKSRNVQDVKMPRKSQRKCHVRVKQKLCLEGIYSCMCSTISRACRLLLQCARPTKRGKPRINMKAFHTRYKSDTFWAKFDTMRTCFWGVRTVRKVGALRKDCNSENPCWSAHARVNLPLHWPLLAPVYLCLATNSACAACCSKTNKTQKAST